MNTIKGRYIINSIIIITLIIGIFSFSVVATQQNNIVNTSNNATSNKKIGWGIKRNDNHEQPDVGSTNKKVLEENQGICLGNNEEKNIYLTFDEGYEAGYTKQILETLKNNNVTATFFLTAHYLNTEPDLVKQMIEEGHIIGNHTPKSLMSINLKVEKL